MPDDHRTEIVELRTLHYAGDYTLTDISDMKPKIYLGLTKISPGTTLFHRKPDSVSYLAGDTPSSDGGVSDPPDLDAKES